MNLSAAAYTFTETEGYPLRSGKIKIKRYKTGRNKTGLLIILPVLLLAACFLYVHRTGGLSLPPFLVPSLSAEEMQQETRMITLPGASHFALQLGAFSEKESAKALAESYRSRGAAGYIFENDSYRVLAAVYASREDARAVQKKLAENHGVDVYLYPLTRSQITLKLSGQRAQLNALSDAMDVCVQLTDTLGTLSQSLDAGSLSKEEATQALQSQQETLRALNTRLSSLFVKEEHPAVTALCALLTQTEQGLSSAAGAANATRLGSGIKYSQLSLLCGLEQYVLALAP